MGMSATGILFFGIKVNWEENLPLDEIAEANDDATPAELINQIQGAVRDLWNVESKNLLDPALPLVKYVTCGHHEFPCGALALRRTIVESTDWGFEELDSIPGDPTPDEIARLKEVYAKFVERVNAVRGEFDDELDPTPDCRWIIGSSYG